MEPDLNQIATSLNDLFTRVATAQDRAPTPELRDQLAALQTSLGEGKARFADEYQRLMADLNARISAAKQSAAATIQAAQQARDRVAAAQAAAQAAKPAAPPPPPELPIDPALGQRLRAELLQHFGDARPAAESDPTAADREIWEDWRWEGDE